MSKLLYKTLEPIGGGEAEAGFLMLVPAELAPASAAGKLDVLNSPDDFYERYGEQLAVTFEGQVYRFNAESRPTPVAIAEAALETDDFYQWLLDSIERVKFASDDGAEEAHTLLLSHEKS
jgi:hypothetical protein